MRHCTRCILWYYDKNATHIFCDKQHFDYNTLCYFITMNFHNDNGCEREDMILYGIFFSSCLSLNRTKCYNIILFVSIKMNTTFQSVVYICVCTYSVIIKLQYTAIIPS